MGQVTVGVVGTSRKPDEHDVTVLTHRSVSASRRRWHPARLVHYARDPERPSRTLALDSSARGSVAEFLAQHDIVVDCILQDTMTR